MATLVFADDFNYSAFPLVSPWLLNKSGAANANGETAFCGNGNDMCAAHDAVLTDLECYLRIGTGTAALAALLVRTVLDGKYYGGAGYALIRANSNSSLSIARISASGSITYLASSAAGVAARGTRQKGMAVGSSISLSSEGVEYLSVTDSTWGSGKVGFGNVGSNYSSYDDFELWNLAGGGGGIKHRVLGSGIVNSRAIVRGAA